MLCYYFLVIGISVIVVLKIFFYVFVLIVIKWICIVFYVMGWRLIFKFWRGYVFDLFDNIK